MAEWVADLAVLRELRAAGATVLIPVRDGGAADGAPWVYQVAAAWGARRGVVAALDGLAPQEPSSRMRAWFPVRSVGPAVLDVVLTPTVGMAADAVALVAAAAHDGEEGGFAAVVASMPRSDVLERVRDAAWRVLSDGAFGSDVPQEFARVRTLATLLLDEWGTTDRDVEAPAEFLRTLVWVLVRNPTMPAAAVALDRDTAVGRPVVRLDRCAGVAPAPLER